MDGLPSHIWNYRWGSPCTPVGKSNAVHCIVTFYWQRPILYWIWGFKSGFRSRECCSYISISLLQCCRNLSEVLLDGSEDIQYKSMYDTVMCVCVVCVPFPCHYWQIPVNIVDLSRRKTVKPTHTHARTHTQTHQRAWQTKIPHSTRGARSGCSTNTFPHRAPFSSTITNRICSNKQAINLATYSVTMSQSLTVQSTEKKRKNSKTRVWFHWSCTANGSASTARAALEL